MVVLICPPSTLTGSGVPIALTVGIEDCSGGNSNWGGAPDDWVCPRIPMEAIWLSSSPLPLSKVTPSLVVYKVVVGLVAVGAADGLAVSPCDGGCPPRGAIRDWLSYVVPGCVWASWSFGCRAWGTT